MYDGSTAPLLANAVFTGISRKSDRSDYITGMVFSDQSGSLAVQQSIDGVNWDISTTHAVTGGTGLPFSDPVYGPYWRLRYTNGGTNQTTFRLGAHNSAAGND